MICIFCQHEVPKEAAQGEEDTLKCPHCGKPAVYRVYAPNSGECYAQGITPGGGYMNTHLAHYQWTPDELEAIAKDLRVQEAAGGLFYNDGSGSGKAGRKE